MSRDFKRLRPGDNISARAENQLRDAAESLTRVGQSSGPPNGVGGNFNGGGAQYFGTDPVPFWAQITAQSSAGVNGYGFQQVAESTPGSWEAVADGLFGDGVNVVAYEGNSNTGVGIGSIVQMWLADAGDSFWFLASSSGGSSTSTYTTGGGTTYNAGSTLTVEVGAATTFNNAPTFNGVATFNAEVVFESEAYFTGLVVLNGTAQTTAGAIWILATGCLLQWYCGGTTHSAEDKANKGSPSGYAGLDANSKVSIAQLALAAKGDLVTTDGTTPQKLAVGSNNQALVAASGATNGIQYATLVAAKGDLLTTDGTNLNQLGVGTNGYVLTADSTQTNGIKWAAASGGGGASQKGTGNGTTTSSYVSLFTLSNSNGLHGSVNVYNTGNSYNISIEIVTTDLYGNTATTYDTIGPDCATSIPLDTNSSSLSPLSNNVGPFTSVQIYVKDFGNSSTYKWAWSTAG